MAVLSGVRAYERLVAYAYILSTFAVLRKPDVGQDGTKNGLWCSQVCSILLWSGGDTDFQVRAPR